MHTHTFHIHIIILDMNIKSDNKNDSMQFFMYDMFDIFLGIIFLQLVGKWEIVAHLFFAVAFS